MMTHKRLFAECSINIERLENNFEDWWNLFTKSSMSKCSVNDPKQSVAYSANMW